MKDKERGGPPRKGRARLDQEYYELFGSNDQAHGHHTHGATGIDFEKYDNIEVEVSGRGRENIPQINSFPDLYQYFNIPQWLQENIASCGYTTPTPVQKNGVPTGLRGYDMMTCAQTGSGKTAAFLTPVVATMDPANACEAGYLRT